MRVEKKRTTRGGSGGVLDSSGNVVGCFVLRFKWTEGGVIWPLDKPHRVGAGDNPIQGVKKKKFVGGFGAILMEVFK